MNKLALLFCFVCAGLPAMAGSVFNVDRIFVDTKAASAIEAREIAVREGQLEALTIVLKRLTPENIWLALPMELEERVLHDHLDAAKMREALA